MYCQACGAANRPDDEFCRKCEQKLLVVSGGLGYTHVPMRIAVPPEITLVRMSNSED